MRENCLVRDYNALRPRPGSNTDPDQTARSGVERTNDEVTVPPNYVNLNNSKADLASIMTYFANELHLKFIKIIPKIIQNNCQTYRRFCRLLTTIISNSLLTKWLILSCLLIRAILH